MPADSNHPVKSCCLLSKNMKIKEPIIIFLLDMDAEPVTTRVGQKLRVLENRGGVGGV